MQGYKRIEDYIAHYIAGYYHSAVEIGIGKNTDVATALADAGLNVSATDIREGLHDEKIRIKVDDIFAPELSLYRGADLLYAVRPGVEMVPPMISIAKAVNCDLLVYHLGNEIYGDGGELVDCGVVLHYYHRRVPENEL